MIVAHLTSVHHRSDTRIFSRECATLAHAKYHVYLIIADGGGDEERAEVTIRDVGKKSLRIARMWKSVNLIFRYAADLKANIYHLHDPELLRIASALKKLDHNPIIIYDAHEDYRAEIMTKPWIPRILRRSVAEIAYIAEKMAIRHVNAIITATPAIARNFRNSKRLVVNINNYPTSDELSLTRERSINRNHQVCYVGSITRVRGIKNLVEAMQFTTNITLVLCGRFSEPEFENSIRQMDSWEKVDYRGQVDRSALRMILAQSIAGIVTFLPTPNHTSSQPNKLFEYMSAELPVIASNFSLWRHIVEDGNAGICVDPESPKEIASAIQRLADNPNLVDKMGRAGKDAVLRRYNWASEADKLIALYRRLA